MVLVRLARLSGGCGAAAGRLWHDGAHPQRRARRPARAVLWCAPPPAPMLRAALGCARQPLQRSDRRLRRSAAERGPHPAGSQREERDHFILVEFTASGGEDEQESAFKVLCVGTSCPVRWSTAFARRRVPEGPRPLHRRAGGHGRARARRRPDRRPPHGRVLPELVPGARRAECSQLRLGSVAPRPVANASQAGLGAYKLSCTGAACVGLAGRALHCLPHHPPCSRAWHSGAVPRFAPEPPQHSSGPCPCTAGAAAIAACAQERLPIVLQHK